MSKPTAAHWTYDDYLAMPDDGKRYEILEGELVLTPSPLPPHQNAAFELAVLLRAHVKARKLGAVYIAPADVMLATDTVVQPDVFVFLEQHRSRTKKTGHFGAPDLVVEVLSPSNARRDCIDKLRIYGRHGVREYWIVDPAAKKIEVFVLEKDRLAKRAEHAAGHIRSLVVLPAFSASLAEIFAEP